MIKLIQLDLAADVITDAVDATFRDRLASRNACHLAARAASNSADSVYIRSEHNFSLNSVQFTNQISVTHDHSATDFLLHLLQPAILLQQVRLGRPRAIGARKRAHRVELLASCRKQTQIPRAIRAQLGQYGSTYLLVCRSPCTPARWRRENQICPAAHSRAAACDISPVLAQSELINLITIKLNLVH